MSALQSKLREPSALVVEDERVSRVLLEKLLARRFSVSSVGDGKAAVSAIESALAWGAPYDLICLDIQMPGWDGHKALQEIRRLEQCHRLELGKGSKVIMVTSLKDSTHVLEAFRQHCDGYLVKPVDVEKLARVLKQIGLGAMNFK